jgi:hypothetical protein
MLTNGQVVKTAFTSLQVPSLSADDAQPTPVLSHCSAQDQQKPCPPLNSDSDSDSQEVAAVTPADRFKRFCSAAAHAEAPASMPTSTAAHHHIRTFEMQMRGSHHNHAHIPRFLRPLSLCPFCAALCASATPSPFEPSSPPRLCALCAL